MTIFVLQNDLQPITDVLFCDGVLWYIDGGLSSMRQNLCIEHGMIGIHVDGITINKHKYVRINIHIV